jgi:hypothetical protein
MGTQWRALCFVASFTVTIGAASAAEDARPEVVDPASTPEAAPAAQDATVPPEAAPVGPTVEVHARVFARASADEREAYARGLSLPSARVGVSGSYRQLDAVIEADLTSSTLVKDAFVRLRMVDEHLRVYGGNFKPPFLGRYLESAWDLPLLSRGLIVDYLVDDHQLGGRRLGFMAQVKTPLARKSVFEVGVFQGAKDELGHRLGEDVAARVSIKPHKDFGFAVSSYAAEVLDGAQRFGVAIEATAEPIRRLHLTTEALAGQIALGRFRGGTALVSYRLPFDREQRLRLEPVVGAELLDVYGQTAGGRGHALTYGLNLLFDDYFKAQLQIERAFRPKDTGLNNLVSFQLAARF